MIFLYPWEASDAVALARGLLTGDDSHFSQALKHLVKKGGISHLTAASGANIHFALEFVSFLPQGVPRVVVMILHLMCVLLYFRTAGLSPSLWRAGLMWGVSWLFLLQGRKIHFFMSTFLVFIITLFFKREYLSQAGFWLSFLAICGVEFSRIFLSSEKEMQLLPKWQKAKQNAKHALKQGFSIYCWVLIYLWTYFQSFEPQGILFTFLIDPWLRLYQWLSLIAELSMVHSLFVLVSAVASVFRNILFASFWQLLSLYENFNEQTMLAVGFSAFTFLGVLVARDFQLQYLRNIRTRQWECE